MPERSDPESLLAILEQSDAQSAQEQAELWESVYPQLRQLAARLMRMERSSHTLRPTALVHEAFMRLRVQSRQEWENRAQFFAIAARVMRRVLVDHARNKKRQKRGGELERVPLDETLPASDGVDELELLALEELLQTLSEHEPRQAQVVEMRVFGGLTMREIAHVLGVTRRTVTSDWEAARRTLSKELLGDDASSLHPVLEDGALSTLAAEALDPR